MPTTNGRVVLRDLADLGQFAHLIVSDAATAMDADNPPCATAAHDTAPATPPAQEPAPVVALSEDDLTALAAAIEHITVDLRAVAEAEAQARDQAASALARHRQLDTATRRLDDAVRRADDVAAQAEALASGALIDDARRQAEHIQAASQSLAATIRARLIAAQRELDGLSTRTDIQRLLEEERRATEQATREAERRRHENALRQRLAQVQALLAEGGAHENEARRLLGALAKDHPNNPEAASLLETLDRRTRIVKERTAERALRQARGHARRAPDEAIALLGALDLDGVPDPLARQVYGCWLAACRGIALAGARHYSPRFGQGAVLVPTADGRLEVVTAIGLPDWTPGRCFPRTALRGARPL